MLLNQGMPAGSPVVLKDKVCPLREEAVSGPASNLDTRDHSHCYSMGTVSPGVSYSTSVSLPGPSVPSQAGPADNARGFSLAAASGTF